MTPCVPGLGETMEQEDGGTFAGLHVMHADAIDGSGVVADGNVHRTLHRKPSKKETVAASNVLLAKKF